MTQWLHYLHGIHIKGELKELYLNLAIRNFALSLIAVFIPIYLLNLGYLLNQVILYQLVYFAVAGIFAIPTAFLSSKYGFKHIVVISIPLMLLQMVLLFSLEYSKVPLYLIAFLGGLSMIFYWLPLNADFAKNSDKKHRGKQAGFLNAVSSASHLLGPLIGALLLKFFSFHLLFFIVLLLMIISTVPLFWTLDIREKSDLRFKVIFSKRHFKYLIKFIGQGMYYVGEGFIWPLFLFLFVYDTLNVGIATTLKGGGAIVFALILGKLSDLKGRKSLIKIGAVLYSLLWIFRQFFQGPIHVFIFSFLGGLLLTMTNIPFFAKVSDEANKEDILEFMTFREIALSIGRLILLTILVLVSYKFAMGFSLAALGHLPFILW